MAYVLEEKITKDNFFDIDVRDRLFFLNRVIIDNLHFLDDMRQWLFEVFQEGLESGAIFDDVVTDKLIDALSPALLDPKFTNELRDSFSKIFEKVPPYSPPYNAIKSILISCLDDKEYPELKDWAHGLLKKKEKFRSDKIETYLLETLEDEKNALSVRREAALSLARLPSLKALKIFKKLLIYYLSQLEAEDWYQETIAYYMLKTLLNAKFLITKKLLEKGFANVKDVEEILRILLFIRFNTTDDEIREVAFWTYCKINDLKKDIKEKEDEETFKLAANSGEDPKKMAIKRKILMIKKKILMDRNMENEFELSSREKGIFIKLIRSLDPELSKDYKIKIYTRNPEYPIVETKLATEEEISEEIFAFVADILIEEVEAIEVVKNDERTEPL